MTLMSTLRGQSIGIAALVVALGGTSYAATALPRNSVTTKQIVNNTVTTKDIKNRTVTKADLAPGVTVSGPRGATGPAGSAVAFALVKADGTFDPALAKNVTGVEPGFSTGVFCFDLAVPARNVQVTLAGILFVPGENVRLAGRVPASAADVTGQCQADHQDAIVYAVDYTHAGAVQAAGDFYVAFN